jgi:hypothetical protein
MCPDMYQHHLLPDRAFIVVMLTDMPSSPTYSCMSARTHRSRRVTSRPAVETLDQIGLIAPPRMMVLIEQSV